MAQSFQSYLLSVSFANSICGTSHHWKQEKGSINDKQKCILQNMTELFGDGVVGYETDALPFGAMASAWSPWIAVF